MPKQLLLLALFLTGIQTIGFSQVDDSTYQKIEEVIVSADGNRKTTFEDSKYYIVDFTISETNTLLLMKSFGKYFIYELDEDMQLRNKLRLKIDANYLFDDCFGNTHIVTKDSVYSILMNDSLGLFLTETHPRDQFMNAMSKCVGSTFEKIIFEKRTHYNQYHKFYTVDLDSGDKKVIYEINDSISAKSMQDAANLLLVENRCGPQKMGNIDGSANNIASHREMNAREDRENFFKSHITRPKYNPLFVVSDTLYFFNHSEGRLDQMDDNGNLISSIEINYHKKDGWSPQVYSDVSQKKFYTVRVENGIQHLIGFTLTENEQNFGSKITKHAYPKKVMVRNGYVYYTYKPDYEANLNKFYRQKI